MFLLHFRLFPWCKQKMQYFAVFKMICFGCLEGSHSKFTTFSKNIQHTVDNSMCVVDISFHSWVQQHFICLVIGFVFLRMKSRNSKDTSLTPQRVRPTSALKLVQSLPSAMMKGQMWSSELKPFYILWHSYFFHTFYLQTSWQNCMM